MAEPDPEGSSSDHVVIDVEAAAAAAEDEGCGDGAAAAAAMSSSSSSCAVCMEAMEWVAVTPCGHREVCVRCAARIRFFQNDRRCCICRTHCATVVVTKASSAGSRRERGGFPAAIPCPPPPAAAASGGQGLVVDGVYHWYHRGMGAYFDDLSQYEEMSKVCVAAAASPSSGAGDIDGVNNQQQPAAGMERPLSHQDMSGSLVFIGVAMVIGIGATFLYMIPT